MTKSEMINEMMTTINWTSTHKSKTANRICKRNDKERIEEVFNYYVKSMSKTPHEQHGLFCISILL